MNGLFSFVLFAKFLDILSKMATNNRRAVAGYTKNTVSIDVHIRILEGLIVWCIMWGLYSYMDISDTSEDSMTPWELLLDGVVYSISAFFETIILLLLCSSSIGINAFKKSYLMAFILSLVLFLLFIILSGDWVAQSSLICINTVIGVRYLLTSMLYMGGFMFSRKTAPNRHAITKYVSFVVPLSVLKAVGRFLMSFDFDSGYCVYDAAKLIFYMVFPPVVYIVLKRDSQYWTEDIRSDTDSSTGWGERTRKEVRSNWGFLSQATTSVTSSRLQQLTTSDDISFLFAFTPYAV